MVLARRLLLVATGMGVLVLGWTLASRNGVQVDVDAVVYRFESVRLWAVLAISFAVGCGLTGLLALVGLVRARLLAGRYRKEIRGLEKELHQLRNLPVAPGSGEFPGESAMSPPGRN